MKVGERQSFDERHGRGVIVVGFARESSDDVCADGRMRKMLANQFHAARKMLTRYQRCIAAKMRSEPDCSGM